MSSRSCNVKNHGLVLPSQSNKLKTKHNVNNNRSIKMNRKAMNKTLIASMLAFDYLEFLTTNTQITVR